MVHEIEKTEPSGLTVSLRQRDAAVDKTSQLEPSGQDLQFPETAGPGFINADSAGGLGSKFHVFCFSEIQFEAVPCEVPGNCVHHSNEEQRGESRALMYSYCNSECLRLSCASMDFTVVDHSYPGHMFLGGIAFSKG
ncbi:hypothetical protein M514_13200 [Trichuris suis]|uniref:Uncharacterized protein n=1 Tax=Trichuris suis TaxID=68888 RepID=A0A085MRK0_9BILA|nr:hypothetical protein M513_13200 [Trichuris suis]KFD59846.1 hypothetical protein M514_13200 [Trichuris suis]